MTGLSFNAGEFIWAVVVFVGLYGLLAKFAFKPIREALDKREQVIRESLARAEAARDEAAKIAEENKHVLIEAKNQAREIVQETHRLAGDMRRQAQVSAKEEAEHIIEQARGELDREVQKSLEELKASVAGLSVRIARQVIHESLDEKRHEELADTFIDRLKKTHARRST